MEDERRKPLSGGPAQVHRRGAPTDPASCRSSRMHPGTARSGYIQ